MYSMYSTYELLEKEFVVTQQWNFSHPNSDARLET